MLIGGDRMKRKKVKSSAEPLSLLLSRNLNAYTLAAGAAGVGLLALTQPAGAEVVYTPAHVNLSGSRAAYALDVNNDGVADFGFNLNNIPSFGDDLQVGEGKDGPSPNGFLFSAVGGFPAVLNLGNAIGPGASFYGCVGSCGNVYMATLWKGGSNGAWLNVTNRYLGLKFYAGKDTYYGWARMSVHVKGIEISARLTGYAYETIPNHGIRAGQTSGTFEKPVYGDVKSIAESSASPVSPAPQPVVTLGMLAMGSPGIPLR
jgi:hypothetical protein